MSSTGGGHDLRNPKHVVELIEDVTVIEFENCLSGVVCNVEGEEFDVEELYNLAPLREDRWHYTRERLLAEFKIDADESRAVDVTYMPFLPDGGAPRNLNAIREAQRLEDAKSPRS